MEAASGLTGLIAPVSVSDVAGTTATVDAQAFLRLLFHVTDEENMPGFTRNTAIGPGLSDMG